MDEFTKKHLAEYAAYHVPDRDVEAFIEYATKQWALDPEYWNDRGWSDMQDRFYNPLKS